MRVNVRILGAQQVRDEIAGMANRMRNLRPAYLKAGTVVLTAAQQRINADGPGWPGTVETSHGSPLQRTGALLRSLSIENATELPNGIRVGTNLMTPDGRFNIGRMMQQGTGIYGPSGSPITAKNGKALRFEVNGKIVYARSVKGSPPRPFLFIDSATAEKISGVFGQYVLRGAA